VFPDVSLTEINELERIYLELLDYRVQISGSEYAKYYFILRTIAERNKVEFPLKPMPIKKALELHKDGEKTQDNMKLEKKLLRKTH